MNIFSAPEILDIGIEKEKKRRDFYGAVAVAFEDKETRELFTRLRDWEEEHIKKFTEIRAGIKETEATDSYPGELSDYIKSFVDDMLYKDMCPEEFRKKITSPAVAIQYGIGFEKDAILFFNEILGFSLPFDKSVIEKLIDEEKQHIVYLAGLRKKLDG